MTIFQGLWGNFGLMIEVCKISKQLASKSISLFVVTTFNLRDAQ